MKEQIKEMDKDIGEAIMHNSVIDIINGGFIGVNSEGIARELYDEGYRKQSEIANDIIAIIEQRMVRNIERLNGCQSDIWKVGYLAENEAYHDIKEIIEQKYGAKMKGGAE